MSIAHKYKAGDPVRDLRCDVVPGVFRELHGEWATVRWEGKIVDSDIHVDNLRHETPEETAKRERIKSYRSWSRNKPELRHAGVRWNSGAVYVGDISTPAEMREAARELQLLADWFEKRPAERSGK